MKKNKMGCQNGGVGRGGRHRHEECHGSRNGFATAKLQVITGAYITTR